MSTKKKAKEIETELFSILENMLLDSSPDKRYPMRFGRDLVVTKQGVEVRNNLAVKLISDEYLGHSWSEQGILETIDNSIQRIGSQLGEKPDTTVSEVAQKLLDDLYEDFEEQDWYLPVIGLKLEKELVIGNITFYPFESKIQELKEHTLGDYAKDLSEHRDSIAKGNYKVESRRATELLREDIEYSLNILRYLGALIWYGQPDRRISLLGEQRTISYAVSFVTGKGAHEISESGLSVVPYNIDSEIIEYAKFYGLEYFQDLLGKENQEEIEERLLLAVQWFGAAKKEVQPLFAFLKFYVPLEILLKKDTDSAKSSVPHRVSTLFYPYKPRGKEALDMNSDLVEIIGERNEVAHSGRPKKRRIENLKYWSEWFAIGVVNRVRQRVQSEKLQSQDDLFRWIKNQRSYLRRLYKKKPKL